MQKIQLQKPLPRGQRKGKDQLKISVRRTRPSIQKTVNRQFNGLDKTRRC